MSENLYFMVQQELYKTKYCQIFFPSTPYPPRIGFLHISKLYYELHNNCPLKVSKNENFSKTVLYSQNLFAACICVSCFLSRDLARLSFPFACCARDHVAMLSRALCAHEILSSAYFHALPRILAILWRAYSQYFRELTNTFARFARIQAYFRVLPPTLSRPAYSRMNQ